MLNSRIHSINNTCHALTEAQPGGVFYVYEIYQTCLSVSDQKKVG